MKRRLLLTATPALLAAPTLRAAGLEAAPPPGAPLPIAVPAMLSFVLPSGLRVVLAPQRVRHARARRLPGR
jgi:hypothetical protein